MRIVMEHLQSKNLYWYEIGILMGISKRNLDEIKIKKERLGFSVAVNLMIEALHKENRFTWRVVIDAIQDMNYHATAESIEDFALKSVAFPESTKTRPKKFSRNDCIATADMRPSIHSEDRLQRYIKKICDLLQLQCVNYEDVLENLYSHIVSKNPSRTKLKSIAEIVEKISLLSNAHSDDLAEQAKKLKDNLEIVKKVIFLLKQEERELETRRTTLEYSSKKIGEEIKKVMDSDMKIKLQNLDQLHQEVMNNIHKVCGQLNDCIKKLDKANANYHAINEQLSICKKTASICKLQIGSCKAFITDLQLNHPDISMNFEIDDVLHVIQNSYERIAEVQRVLDEAEKPYDVSPQPPQEEELQLFVMNNAGEIVPLRVEPTCNVRELKHKIHNSSSIPITHQFLLFADNELSDKSIISECDIHTHSLLHLSIGIKINVKGSGEDMSFIARESDTIRAIKMHIHDCKSNLTPNSQCLMLANKKLKDEYTLSFYEIQDDDTLDLSLWMQIYVEVTALGPKICFSVLNSDTVKTVKDRIHEMGGMPQNQQQLLTMAGKELNDADHLFDYHMSSQSKLTLKLIQTDVPVVNTSCACTIL